MTDSNGIAFSDAEGETFTAPGPGYGQAIAFSDAEGETFTAPGPGYGQAIAFSDAEGETFTAPGPGYGQAIAFSDAEGETFTAPGPGYGQAIAFSDAEGETFTAPGPGYGQAIAFSDAEGETFTAPGPGYGQAIAFSDAEGETFTAPGPGYGQAIAFSDAEGETFTAPGPGYGQAIASKPGRRMATASAIPEIPNRIEYDITNDPHTWPPWWPPQFDSSDPRPWPKAPSGGISFELEDAWQLPPPPGIRTDHPMPQAQVLSWLTKHRSAIVAAAQRFRVDRRAIAGAIAWEALRNVWPMSARAVGPGKIHVNANVVLEAERAGYVPKRTSRERATILKTPEGAITYIAAIMSALSDIAEDFGFDIRNRPDILTNEYNGRGLSVWAEHLSSKTDEGLVGANPMATWTSKYLGFLERAVGQPVGSY